MLYAISVNYNFNMTMTENGYPPAYPFFMLG